MAILTSNSSLENEPRLGHQLTCPCPTCHSSMLTLMSCIPIYQLPKAFHPLVYSHKQPEVVSNILILQRSKLITESYYLSKVTQLELVSW